MAQNVLNIRKIWIIFR